MKDIILAKQPEGDSPWHTGEKQIQASLGVAGKMEAIGRRVLRPFMPDQHREFYNQLPFVVAGVVDETDQPWATVLAKPPGFLHSPHPQTLNVQAVPDANDPARAGFRNGAGIGFLGIELHTRRRNRVNGVISQIWNQGFAVRVEQTMGNCPKYIQLRNYTFVDHQENLSPKTTEQATELSTGDMEAIRSADSFFVASFADKQGQRQVDASHRGGKPGFVRVDAQGILTIPDFSGNLFFNTLGNILLNGKAGLIFVNYGTGDVLQLTGQAEVILDSPEISAFEGAERLWTFKPTKIVRRRAALPIRWDFQEYSPFVLPLGSWEQVEENLKNARYEESWRPLRVAKIVDESQVIRSFYLENRHGESLETFQAGQHLPLRMQLENGGPYLQRTYTLSSAPSDALYRISVKRDGRVSRFLHDQLKVGDILETRPPQGGFTLDPEETRPVVMLAGGVGITPMIAMAREMVALSKRSGTMRATWLFQAAKSPVERAFDQELKALIQASSGALRRIRVGTHETEYSSNDRCHPGRMDIDLLKATLPFDDFDFYLCGPPSFMQAMYDALRGIGVRDFRIFAEAFGPAALTRQRDLTEPKHSITTASQEPVAVAFATSAKEARWQPGKGTLLELAEDRGLAPPFSCRSGSCGSCRTKILNGAVAYPQQPSFPVKPHEALICCAVPAAGARDQARDRLILDL